MTMSTPRAEAPAEPGPPARPPRRTGRVLAAVLSALAGAGLLAAAAAETWAGHRAADRTPAAGAAYRKAASLWRDTPVDTLFPPVLDGRGAGPGGADRSWTRTALAPDADCPAALAPDWQTLLAPTGCTRVLRATYTDATRSSLVTVGLVFTPALLTPAGAPAPSPLTGRLTAPPGYGFADDRRAAWTASVLAEAPVVVYTVSAFADGRRLEEPPRPARELTDRDAAAAVARAGLGHEAEAVADRFGRALRTLAAPPPEDIRPTPSRPPAKAAPLPAPAPEPAR
ncbi:hypothetical protein [Streptomyces sp. NPDC051567]|uniref:hypothetical protein n=1 Tax=Streptomyces sp. NPDC051567 TaxID=3365660 RepID=UPI0037B1344C